MPWERGKPRRRVASRQSGARGKAPPRSQRFARAASIGLGILVVGAGLYGIVLGDHLRGFGAKAGDGIDALAVALGFGLERVTVSGRNETDEAAVIGALGVKLGQSVFRIDCVAVRARLIALDWVSDAKVRRLLPNRLHVEIVERRPLAIWQDNGALFLIDQMGRTIKPVTAEALLHYRHVVGEGAARHAAALFDVLGRFPEVESRVRAAIRVGQRRWNLQLDNGVLVELPAKGVADALGDLMRLQKEQGIFDRDLVAIDLRLKDKWILRRPGGVAEKDLGPSLKT